jgi:hypothetical protein
MLACVMMRVALTRFGNCTAATQSHWQGVDIRGDSRDLQDHQALSAMLGGFR